MSSSISSFLPVVIGILAFGIFFFLPIGLIILKMRQPETKEEWEKNVEQSRQLDPRYPFIGSSGLIKNIVKKRELPFYVLIIGILVIAMLYLMIRLSS